MRCRKSRYASPYMDGEISERKKKMFEAHLGSCPECAGFLAELHRMREIFLQAEFHHAPLGFPARVPAKVRAGERSGFGWMIPMFKGFAEAAAVLAVITLGLVSGELLMNGAMSQKTGGFAASFSLDIFDPVPPDSVGGTYLAMMEVDDEK